MKEENGVTAVYIGIEEPVPDARKHNWNIRGYKRYTEAEG